MSSLTILSRLSARSPPLALKLNKKIISPATSSLRLSSQSQVSDSMRRVSWIKRLPLELSSMGSMMPLHSAIASARMQSLLSVESQSWGLVPQGISMPF